MKTIFYQIKFIILGLIILPICEYLANLFFYVSVVSLDGGWSEIFTYMEIAIIRVTTYFFKTLFIVYQQSILPMTIFIIAYSFYYKTNKSLKMMAGIWAGSGAVITYIFIWKFMYSTLRNDEGIVILYAFCIFALAGAFAAFLMHLLMAEKNSAPSLHDTFK